MEVVGWQSYNGDKEKTAMAQKTYDRQTAKFLACVGENMPKMSGDIMQGWIENPRALQKFLRGLVPTQEANQQTFPLWKSITLGIHKDAIAYQKALKNADCKVDDWARDIMAKPGFTVVSEEAQVDLVRATTRELGFPKGATRKDIYERAKELGLDPCPGEVGPALRLIYQDQPLGEWLLVAMEPIADSDGGPRVFRVGRCEDGLWLYTGWDNPDGVWDPVNCWVFLSRK